MATTTSLDTMGHCPRCGHTTVADGRCGYTYPGWKACGWVGSQAEREAVAHSLTVRDEVYRTSFWA